jgi:putative glutamine amidotransferase
MFALITQKEGFNQYGEPNDSLMRMNIGYVRSLGFTPLPVPNDIDTAREMAGDIDYRFLLVTGGGFAPREYFAGDCDGYVAQPLRDEVERFLVEDAAAKDVPMMGLCRGMHMLNGIFGGKVLRNASHSAPRHDHYVRFAGGGRALVNTFHNNAVSLDTLSPAFTVLALEEDTRNVECYCSEHPRILGLQWHPERPLPSPESIEASAQLAEWLLKGTALPKGIAPRA